VQPKIKLGHAKAEIAERANLSVEPQCAPIRKIIERIHDYCNTPDRADQSLKFLWLIAQFE
jgi:hypothetical protein